MGKQKRGREKRGEEEQKKQKRGFALILRDREMEKEGKNQKGCSGSEPDFLLRWGNKKRLRFVKVKDGRNVPEKSDCLGSKKITSRVDHRVVTAEKEIPSPITTESSEQELGFADEKQRFEKRRRLHRKRKIGDMLERRSFLDES